MEKTLSNELFVVGVSLDCLRAGVPDGSFLDSRLSALSGQVLSDSKKIEDLEISCRNSAELIDELRDFCRDIFDEFNGTPFVGLRDLILKGD